MKRVLVCAVLIVLAVGASHAEDVSLATGRARSKQARRNFAWSCTLPRTTTAPSKPRWTALIRGANGIPVTSISLKDSKLNFTVDAVHGSYDGKITADATEISGTWTQEPCRWSNCATTGFGKISGNKRHSVVIS